MCVTMTPFHICNKAALPLNPLFTLPAMQNIGLQSDKAPRCCWYGACGTLAILDTTRIVLVFLH